MIIDDFKLKLHQLEENNTRYEVYCFLRGIWERQKDHVLAFIIIDEMTRYLIWIESTEPLERPDEHILYESFYNEVMSYAYHHYLTEKLFLWLCIFYLSSVGTYYYILNTELLAKNGYDKGFAYLRSIADTYYPNSVMFKLIPSIQKECRSEWSSRLSKEELLALDDELQKLELRNNAADAFIIDAFSD